MHRVFNRLLVFIVVSSLVACGFHLRGPVELSSAITPLYLDNANKDQILSHELKMLLSQSENDSTTQSKAEAKSVLNIVDVRKKQRVVAVDDQGRARQYDLSYIVRFSFTGKDVPQTGEDNIQQVKLKRDIAFNPDSVLAINREMDQLYENMKKDAARLILQRVKAIGLKAEEQTPQ